MAVYRIALRVNGADGPAHPPTSGVGKNAYEDGKAKTQSEKSPSRFRVDQINTPQYRQQLYQKTVSLIVARTLLNKKLSRAFSHRNRFSHKLLNDHYRLKRQESKHLIARTRLVVELEQQQKLKSSAERAKNIRLLKKLLRTFKRHLKSDTYAPNSLARGLRHSPLSSISTSLSSSDMDEHEDIDEAFNEECRLNDHANLMALWRAMGPTATPHKPIVSQRLNTFRASNFAQDHAEPPGQDVDGALPVTKQIKKLKHDSEAGLDKAQALRPTNTFPASTQSVGDAKEGKVEACPGNDADFKPKADQKTPQPATPSWTKLVAADNVRKEANVVAEFAPSATQSGFEDKAEKSYTGALAVASPSKPDVDHEKKAADVDETAVESPTPAAADVKHEANVVTGALSPAAKPEAEEKETTSCAGALPVSSPPKPEVADEKKTAGSDASATVSPTTLTTDAKEKRANSVADAVSSPAKSPNSDKESKIVDASVCPRAKKHSLDSDGDQTKAKRARVESFVTPPVPAKSPRKITPPPPLQYHEQAVYDMLNDPIGYDDLVYDKVTGPSNRDNFLKNGGWRVKEPARNFIPVMSGGIGKDMPENSKPSRSAGVPRARKPLPSGRRGGERRNFGKEDSLSQQAHRKNFRDRMKQNDQEINAPASPEKKSSALNALTEPAKYSVSKEARYARYNASHLEHPGLARAGITRPKLGQSQSDSPRPKPKTYVSAARRKHNAVRQADIRK